MINKLTVVFIRPTNYDDDGYVIRYVKGVLPSNTIACMRSLTLEFTERWKRDYGIDITVECYDEFVEKVPITKFARKNGSSHKVVAALVGVQSNQYPRAADLAMRLTDHGIKALIGGFHVSGILAMFGEPTPEINDVIDYGVTVVQGEAELVWESILHDVVNGCEKSIYRMTNYPDISNKPVPQADTRYMRKFAVSHMGTVDCSRGCPFNCSFCTIVNVQGRHMRCRSANSILATIRNNLALGINHYFFTDDNFSRNTNWESIFDGLIEMREQEGLDISFMMQVDTVCDRIPNFVEKAGRAGCTQVFIGMESLNPDNLKAVQKNQNNVENYASYIAAWHRENVMTHVGYIIGFPFDTLESVKRDVDNMMNVIKVDQASFFILTPLPGSVDHKYMVDNNLPLDPDLNNYDSFHITTEHPLMTRDETLQAYDYAWTQFYRFENLKKVLMRAGTKAYWNIFKNIMWYKNSLLEPRHPMVAGFIRRKHRTDVRPGTPVLSRRQYYFTRLKEYSAGLWRRIGLFFELQELWMLTRKPDDPTFKLVADFTTALSETKGRIAAIEIGGSYARWKEETIHTLAGLRERIVQFYNAEHLPGRKRKRLNNLIDEMDATLQKAHSADYHLAMPDIAGYLNRCMRLAEDFSLKNVARRRRITDFWILTLNRLRHGRIFSFMVSLPKIAVSGLRDFIMSLSFAWHLSHKKF